jgi:transposase InsO family protein
MPFEETRVVEQRLRFVEEAERSQRSFSEVCRRYGISRKAGYKWVERWQAEGLEGLKDRSSRPRSSPAATAPEVVEAIVSVRRRYPDYGAKKIRWYLERHRPELELPSRTTIHNIIRREGLVPESRKRTRRWHPGRPTTEAAEPNAIWSTDFKGEFPTKDGKLCYPLTVQDIYSRYLLTCRARDNVRIDGAKPVFKRLFREFGLPEKIRSDNGTPFASNALGRLSRLSVWFVLLGIRPEFIEPGHPEQNDSCRRHPHLRALETSSFTHLRV